MNNLVLTEYFYRKVKKVKKVEPRQSYIQYYHDLYQRECLGELEFSSLHQGGQFNFVELGDSVLKYFTQKKGRIDIGAIVYIGMSEEYDPMDSYGHVLMNKYHLNSPFIDLSDRGLFGLFIAIKFSQLFMTSFQTQSLLIIAMQQSTQARRINEVCMHPNSSNAMGLLLKATKKNQERKVLYSEVLSVSEYTSEIKQLIREHEHQNKEICLFISYLPDDLEMKLHDKDFCIVNITQVSELFSGLWVCNDERYHSSTIVFAAGCRESTEAGIFVLSSKQGDKNV